MTKSRQEMTAELVEMRSKRLYEAYPEDQALERTQRFEAEYKSMKLNALRVEYARATRKAS